MTFGALLKRAREEFGMTQDALADELGIAQGDLCRIEKGARKPSARLARRIAEYLGIDLKEASDVDASAS